MSVCVCPCVCGAYSVLVEASGSDVAGCVNLSSPMPAFRPLSKEEMMQDSAPLLCILKAVRDEGASDKVCWAAAYSF